MNDDLGVKFSVNTDDVPSKIGGVKAKIEELGVAATVASERMSRGFDEAKEKAVLFGEKTETSLRGMISMRARLAEIAELMVAAFAIEQIAHFAEKMGDAAEKTVHMAQTFGITVGEIQQLGAIAADVGMDVGTVTRGIGLMDRNLVNAASGTGKASMAFKQLGISLDDGRGNMEKLMVVAEKFREMDDGPKKVALAMTVFGRAGKELIPILNMGREGIQEINAQSEKYGAVNQIAVEKGFALADALDEGKIAALGMSNVMTDALSPAFTELVNDANEMIGAFIESYREGGAAAVAMGVLAGSIRVVGVTIEETLGLIGDLVDAIVELGGVTNRTSEEQVHDYHIVQGVIETIVLTVKVFANAAVIAFASVVTAVMELASSLLFIANLIVDTMTGQLPKIADDWHNYQQQIAQDAEYFSSVAGGAWAKASRAIDDFTRKAQLAQNADPIRDSSTSIGRIGLAPYLKTGGDFDYDPAGPKLGGGSKRSGSAAPKDEVVQNLERALDSQKLAYGLRQAAQGTYEQWSIASDEKYWSDILKRTDLSEKQRSEIGKKWLAANNSLLKERQAAAIGDAKQSEAIALELARNEVDIRRAAIQDEIADVEEARNLGRISATRELQEKAQLNSKLYDLDSHLEAREYNIKLKALQDEKAIVGETPAYYKRIDDQIELLTKQHLGRMVLMTAQANAKMKADSDKVALSQRSVWNQTFQGFSQNIARMVTLQQGFMATVQGMWQSIQQIAARAIENIVTNWLVGLATKEAASSAFHAKSVMHDAKQAAAGAYNALVHIPIVGPVLAPIGAAVAFAAVSAFSAEGGDWNVKPGLYELHKDEMVLPAWAASPLRNMVQSGTGIVPPAASNNNGQMGDVHFHINAIDGQSVKRMLLDNKGHVAGALRKHLRDGGR